MTIQERISKLETKVFMLEGPMRLLILQTIITDDKTYIDLLKRELAKHES